MIFDRIAIHDKDVNHVNDKVGIHDNAKQVNSVNDKIADDDTVRRGKVNF